MAEELLSADADRLLAVGFSVVVNLGGERQVTLNGLMPFDMPVGVTKTRLSSRRTDKFPSQAAMKPRSCRILPSRTISFRD